MNVFTSNAKVVLYFFTFASFYIYLKYAAIYIAIKVILNTCIVMKRIFVMRKISIIIIRLLYRVVHPL